MRLSGKKLVWLNPVQKIWATGIVLATAAGFVLEYFSRGMKRRYAVVAVGLGAWSVVNVLDIFSIQPELGHIAILTGLAVTAGNLLFGKSSTYQGEANEEAGIWNRTWLGNAVAICLGLGVVALGQFTGQFFSGPGNVLISPAGWLSAIQMLVTSLTIFTTAFRMHRDRMTDEISLEKVRALLGGGALISRLAMWTVGLALGTHLFPVFAGLRLVIPVTAAMGSFATKDSAIRRGMQLVASVTVSTLLVCLGSRQH